MTTVSGSTSALNSLASLYAGSSTSGSGTSSLSGDQASSLISMVEDDGSTSSSGIDALLGETSSSDAGSTDLNSILDEIAAQNEAKAASAATSDGTTTSATSTATTQQQKAATLMQSVYKTEQSNLFTLLG